MKILGVTIGHFGPIRLLHHRWTEGLTVAYGRNGAGKTAFLAAINMVCSGERGDKRWRFESTAEVPQTFVHLDLEDDPTEAVSALMGLPGMFESQVSEEDLAQASEFIVKRIYRGIEWSSLNDVVELRVGHEQAVEEGFRGGRYLTCQFDWMRGGWYLWASLSPEPVGSPFKEILGRWTERANGHLERYRDPSEGLEGLPLKNWDEPSSDPSDAVYFRHPTPMAFLQDETPPWVPRPFVLLGKSWNPPIATFHEKPMGDLASFTLQQLVEEYVPIETDTMRRIGLRSPTNYFEELVDPPGLRTQQPLLDVVAKISDRSNEMLSKLLIDPPSLCLRVTEPEEWILGNILDWDAIDHRSRRLLPLDALSRSENRWASVAAQWATLDIAASSRPSVVIIDEPEAAVHAAGVGHTLAGLENLAAETNTSVVVASHSPIFASSSAATRVHIYRGLDGTTHTQRLEDSLSHDLEHTASVLGARPGDVLLMTRVFLVVEGEADQRVLVRLFQDELEQNHIRIVPMRGTRMVKSILDSELVFEATDAKVLVLVDNTRSDVADLWREAAAFADQEDAEARILKGFQQLGRKLSSEEEKMRALMAQAIEKGKADRLHILGLSRDDIVAYTSASQLGLTETWDEIIELKGDTPLKKWLATNRQIHVTPDLIVASLDDDYIHHELTEVIDRAIQLSRM